MFQRCVCVSVPFLDMQLDVELGRGICRALKIPNFKSILIYIDQYARLIHSYTLCPANSSVPRGGELLI